MRPPNILLLFTDQQRHDTIAALGNPVIKTPSLDRLVSEGTTFRRAYTPCPVCMAARASLMTGLPPHANGCVDNRDFPPESQRSFASVLAAQGYQTHGVGKMHFAPDWRRSWGFESRDTSEEVKEGHDYRSFIEENGFGHVFELCGPRGEFYYLPQPSQLPEKLHETAWVADRSIAFLRRRDRSRPFFLMSSFIKPHPPFESPAPWHRLYRCDQVPMAHIPDDYRDYWTRINVVQNRYKHMDQVGRNDRLLRTMKAAYYAAVSFIDRQVGRILAALEASGELDDTLIILTSDHGEMLGDYLCFGKRCLLEASVRVPLVARFPRAFRAGAQVRTPVSLLDLFPTFAEAAGAPVDVRRPHEAGTSLFGLTGPDVSRHVVLQFEKRWMGHYGITDGRWKYCYSAPDRKEWLFRIDDRGCEGTNLARDSRYRPRLETLRRSLQNHLRRDGYDEPLRGSGWRRWRVPPFPSDPDYGLMYQDEATTQARVDALGASYARRVTHADPREAFGIVLDHTA